MRPVALEIAAATVADVRAAVDGGADRVELCHALELGGLTPSIAAIEAAVGVGLPVNVLIRPRAGDFIYDADDLAVMLADVRRAVGAGADGVVIGALTASADLEEDITQRLVDAARACRPAVQVTYHRAIDHARDPQALLGTLREIGVDRVLTSGGAESVCDGVQVLPRLVAAAGEVSVTAGGGLRTDCVPAIVACGVAAVHTSASRPVVQPGNVVALGRNGGTGRSATDPELVRALRNALDAVVA